MLRSAAFGGGPVTTSVVRGVAGGVKMAKAWHLTGETTPLSNIIATAESRRDMTVALRVMQRRHLSASDIVSVNVSRGTGMTDLASQVAMVVKRGKGSPGQLLLFFARSVMRL